MDYLPALHTEAETRAFIRDVVCSHKVWLAEDDGGDAGALGFAACKDGFLHHLYVSPGAQNCGAGGRLLRQVKTAMPDGFRLWCFQANRGARRFYERHGLYCARLTPGGGNEENLPDALYVWPGIETKETEP